jgi:apolipoprotein D and lipocalin family protein
VSFFGPFYGSYVVFKLDPDYQHALVSGPNRSYLWLLSRTPTLPQSTIDAYVATAAEAGFATDKLIFVDQSSVD